MNMYPVITFRRTWQKCINCRKRFLHLSARQFENNSQVRVRFAPSPTGQLHLGGLRTALYNYLFTRSNAGKFILRIEDTDQVRVVPQAAEKMMDMLHWAGISVDEGPVVGGSYGPYVQSLRLEEYQEKIKVLLENGSAYHCFCTSKRLKLLRREATMRREVPKYDNKCRHLTTSEVQENLNNNVPCSIRFKLEPMKELWHDMVYGDIRTTPDYVEGDPILMKSDGFPTYHFANVVDDHLMHISHVLRGGEWQVSTPKHILLFKAFGWQPPVYGHLPLLLNEKGLKLSKREDDLHVENLQNKGYFPETIINLLCMQGSAFKVNDVSGFTMQDLIDNFDITKMNTRSTQLNMDLIDGLNSLHLKSRAEDDKYRHLLMSQLKNKVAKKYADRKDAIKGIDEIILTRLLKCGLEHKESSLEAFVTPRYEFVYITPTHDKLQTLKADWKDQETKLNVLKKVKEVISNHQGLLEHLDKPLKKLASENNLKYKHLMHLIRISLSDNEDYQFRV